MQKFVTYGIKNIYNVGPSLPLKIVCLGFAEDRDRQEHLLYGGPRFCTFMIYLSDVEAGGRTVFPTVELSVEPEAGSALFWFNLDSGGYTISIILERYRCLELFL